MSINYADVVTFGNNVPCFNRGCRYHVKSPCEMCGRVMAQGIAEVRSGFLTVYRSGEVEIKEFQRRGVPNLAEGG